MNLFKKAKISGSKEGFRNCRWCGKKYKGDKRNLNRGWGLCCSKSCASSYKLKMNNLSGSEKIMEERDKKLDQLGI